MQVKDDFQYLAHQLPCFENIAFIPFFWQKPQPRLCNKEVKETQERSDSNSKVITSVQPMFKCLPSFCPDAKLLLALSWLVVRVAKGL